MKIIFGFTFFTYYLIIGVNGHPNGAPVEACGDVTDIEPNHGSNNASNNDVPYYVNLTEFNDTYIPEEYYLLDLVSSDDTDYSFRGFMIQARAVADDSPVGYFVFNDSIDYQPQCVNDTAATHRNNATKSYVTLSWVAPPAGTGTIKFRYAFVMNYTTYWANLTTDPIEEDLDDSGPGSGGSAMPSVMFSQSSYSFDENDGAAQPVLVLSNAQFSTDITVNVTSTDQSATGGGIDYDSGLYTVTIPAGMTSVPFNVPITNDNILEGNETFILTINRNSFSLSNNEDLDVGMPDEATVTIVDNDQSMPSVSPASDDGLSTGAIVGIIVGIVVGTVVVIILAIGIYTWISAKKAGTIKVTPCHPESDNLMHTKKDHPMNIVSTGEDP